MRTGRWATSSFFLISCGWNLFILFLGPVQPHRYERKRRSYVQHYRQYTAGHSIILILRNLGNHYIFIFISITVPRFREWMIEWWSSRRLFLYTFFVHGRVSTYYLLLFCEIGRGQKKWKESVYWRYRDWLRNSWGTVTSWPFTRMCASANSQSILCEQRSTLISFIPRSTSHNKE